MKAVAETIGVARSHLNDKVHRAPKPRGPYRKPEDDDLGAAGSPPGRRASDLRLSPDHGSGQQGTRQGGRASSQPQARLPDHAPEQHAACQAHGPQDRPCPRRQGHRHALEPALVFRWLRIACWNGDLIRIAFIIDAHDREIIAWHAVVGSASAAAWSGHDAGGRREQVRPLQSPAPLEWLTDNGSPYTAKETRDFATALNLIPCFTPVQSPESTAYLKASSKPSNATMLASILCRMRSPRSATSPDGSRTTTRTILTQGSECAPRGSSSGHKLSSLLSGQIGATPRPQRLVSSR